MKVVAPIPGRQVDLQLPKWLRDTKHEILEVGGRPMVFIPAHGLFCSLEGLCTKVNVVPDPGEEPLA